MSTAFINWYAVRNTESESVPPFGVMRVVGADADGTLQVARPSTNGQTDVLIGGPWIIPAGAKGQGYQAPVMAAYYDAADGTPVAGETWGAGAGVWWLKKTNKGFLVKSTGNGTSCDVMFALAAAGGTAVTTDQPNTFTEPQTITDTSIGTSVVPGMTVANTTAASAGAQQYSPALTLSGSGWSTDAGGASMPVDWSSYVATIQGAAAPTGQIVWASQINGGGYVTQMTLDSSGNLTTTGYTTTDSLHLPGATSGTAVLQAPATGGGTITLPSGTVTLATTDASSLASGTLDAARLPTTVPQWVKVATLSYTDFSAAATTNTISSGYTLPAATVVHGVVLKHTASFTGGAIAAYTISVGKTGSATYWSGALNVFAAPSGTGFRTQSTGTAALPTPEDFSATTDVKLTANSVGANLNAATAGSVELWLCLATLP